MEIRLKSTSMTSCIYIVPMRAVQVVRGSALNICFGFANRDDAFDGSAFYVLLKNF